jgi:molecular chaperone GrpE
LKSENIQVIETVGKQFDPKFHDALCQENGPEGIIVTEIEKGYTYKGEVLRAAKVTVGNGTGDSELQCNDN